MLITRIKFYKNELLIAICIFIPIFVKLTHFGERNYRTVIFFLLFYLFIRFINTDYKNIFVYNKINNLILFNKILITIITFHIILEYNRFFYILDRSFLQLAIPAFSLLLIGNIANKDIKKIKISMEKLFFIIGIIFIIQLTISCIESYYGTPFINYGYTTYNSIDINTILFNKRSILGVFGIDLPFKFPISMLIGQWNWSAPLLVFYNLIFITMFKNSKSFYYGILCIAVLFAALINTTRAAIISIVITDLIVLFVMNERVKIKKFLILILTIYTGSITYNSIVSYFYRTDTLSSRFNYYSAYVDIFFNHFVETIFGYGLIDGAKIGAIGRSSAGYGGGSFESFFFSFLFQYGLVSLLIFCIFLISIFRKGYYENTHKYLYYLLVLNILGVSLTIGGILSLYAYSMFTIYYIYLSVISHQNIPQIKSNN